jgi:hypothetical protein
VDHGMSPDFEANQNQGYDGKQYLEPLGTFLPGSQLAAPPLRGGTGPEAPDPGEDGKVDKGAGGGESEHGDPDRVLVEAASGSIDATCRSQGGETDGDADAADSENCRAEALQQRHEEAGAAQGAQPGRGARGWFSIRVGDHGQNQVTAAPEKSTNPISSWLRTSSVGNFEPRTNVWFATNTGPSTPRTRDRFAGAPGLLRRFSYPEAGMTL